MLKLQLNHLKHCVLNKVTDKELNKAVKFTVKTNPIQSRECTVNELYNIWYHVLKEKELLVVKSDDMKLDECGINKNVSYADVTDMLPPPPPLQFVLYMYLHQVCYLRNIFPFFKQI